MILLRTSFASGHDGRICTDPEEISTTLTKKNKKKEIKKKKKKKLVDNTGRFCFVYENAAHCSQFVSLSSYWGPKDPRTADVYYGCHDRGGTGKSLASQGAKNP